MNPLAAAWTHPQLLAQVLRPRRDGRSEVALRCDAITQPRAALALEQALRALPGVQHVAIQPAAHRVRVVWDADRLGLDDLLAQCAAAHCPAEPLIHDAADTRRATELHSALKRLLVAGMCMMQVMSYALVIYLGVVDAVDVTTRNLFRWLGFLTTIPLVAYSAWPFYTGALAELRQRRLGIHLPVALAVLLVFAASAVNTVRGAGEIYFDSIGMFVFLLLVGRYVELRARALGNAQGDAAIDAAPLLAQRYAADGRIETVPALALVPGDRVHLAEGATVPADGTLDTAAARFDETLLTGESRPVQRHHGEPLIAGSVLLDGPGVLRVEQVGAATASARIGALAVRARRARLTVPAGDRAIGRFIARVLVLTALTAAAWLLVNPARAFDSAVAVLVVACPCAFALTAPAAYTRALAVLARRGVLVTNAAALGRLADVDAALFDKTGTLGVPQLDLSAIEPLGARTRDEVLALAGALARESSHPLAQAVTRIAGSNPNGAHATAVEAVAGAGLRGLVAGRKLRFGRADFALAGQPVPAALREQTILADDTGALAVFHLAERPRADAGATLATLRSEGVSLSMASGDTPARVAQLAAALHIDDWHARQTPETKLAHLQSLRAAGRTVLVVGDGSNDAPILAGADVSAALASGTSLAHAQADLLLLDDHLDGLVHARRTAQDLQLIVAQGRRWSLVYNLCAVPFAAFGLVTPWLAAIGMSLSSLAVVLNALRTGREPLPAAPQELPA
ncbi:MAG: cation-translocating P-type ATPase [Rhodanobacter sp.]|nr:MAG: cation-translocating P-type ATPase [Rhodanobacter sp.]TAM10475.1 MAG: cation-translocating P-type ATPase [Rhodanobacter sp.]TAM36322.1 MAG: cation-translocating P-type ATPase [Rhodanobacter sp.]